MTASHLIKTAPPPYPERLNIVEGIDGSGGKHPTAVTAQVAEIKRSQSFLHGVEFL